MVLMPLLSRLLTLLVILTMPLFLARLTLIPIKSLSICFRVKIGRAVQQECRDRYRMPSSAGKKKDALRDAPDHPARAGARRAIDKLAVFRSHEAYCQHALW